jgi:DNA repair protein RecO (recombination protein O)
MSRIRLSRTDAVILRRRDYGEADRILTLFTPARGKVAAIAKGVRRVTSRSAGHVELFSHCNVLLAQGRNLDVLTQSETLDGFLGLRADLVRLACASHAAELVDRLSVEEQSNPGVFRALVDVLGALAGGDDPALATRHFEMRLLGALGYEPQLFQCVECGDELQADGNAYAASHGGVLCPDCAIQTAQPGRLDTGVFKALRFLQTRPWELARRLELSARTAAGLEACLLDTLRFVLEKDLRSVEFLDNIRRLGGPPATRLAS